MLILIFSSLPQVATKTLPFYKDYFNVPYPLPKIDLIAIADFAAGQYTNQMLIIIVFGKLRQCTDFWYVFECCLGAMENWGLVTYR